MKKMLPITADAIVAVWDESDVFDMEVGEWYPVRLPFYRDAEIRVQARLQKIEKHESAAGYMKLTFSPFK